MSVIKWFFSPPSSELRAEHYKEKRREEKRREEWRGEVTELSYFGLRRSSGGSGLIMCSQLTSPVNVITRFLVLSL